MFYELTISKAKIWILLPSLSKLKIGQYKTKIVFIDSPNDIVTRKLYQPNIYNINLLMKCKNLNRLQDNRSTKCLNHSLISLFARTPRNQNSVDWTSSFFLLYLKNIILATWICPQTSYIIMKASIRVYLSNIVVNDIRVPLGIHPWGK